MGEFTNLNQKAKFIIFKSFYHFKNFGLEERIDMSEIKIFRIMGTYVKNRKKYLFRKEVRALKEEDALEKVISQITSIGLYRRQISIKDIKEISPEECENILIRDLSK